MPELTVEQCKAIDELVARADRAEANHYALLGVESTATRQRIRQSFYAAAKVLHPDAYYGKRLGAYRPRLERAFERLSRAYTVLGTPSRRLDYDAYLANAGRAVELQQKAAAAQPELAAAPVLSPSRQRQAQGALGRSAIEGLERALPARPAIVPAEPVAAAVTQVAQAAAPKAPGKAEAAWKAQRWSLTRSGVGPVRPRTLVTQLLDEAEEGVRRGDRISAVRQLDLVSRLDHGEAGWQPRHQDRYDRLTLDLADTITQMGLYEERHQHWAKAARSWMRLCEVRPADPECARRAAHALVQASGDLRQALRLADRATVGAPGDYRNHEVLAQALLAAKLPTRAHRTLLHAQQLRAEAEAAERAASPNAATAVRSPRSATLGRGRHLGTP